MPRNDVNAPNVLVGVPEGFFWRVKEHNNRPGNVRLYLMRKRRGILPAKYAGYAPGEFSYGFHYSMLGRVSELIWDEYMEEQISSNLSGDYPPRILIKES
jgi:hypothetical protein